MTSLGVVIREETKELLVTQDKYKVLCAIIVCVCILSTYNSQQDGSFLVASQNMQKTLVYLIFMSEQLVLYKCFTYNIATHVRCL